MLNMLGSDVIDGLRVAQLSEDALRTSAIEGERFSRDSIRESIRHRFGLRQDPSRCTSGEQSITDLATNVYTTYAEPLTHTMLCEWHMTLMGHAPIAKVGTYRGQGDEVCVGSQAYVGAPVQVHFQAMSGGPRIVDEMTRYIDWYTHHVRYASNPSIIIETLALAHCWFESIHPFEDGNGRIGRALVDKAISKMIGRPSFIPISSEIHVHQRAYYDAINKTNRGLEITDWVLWFGRTVVDAQKRGEHMIECVLMRSAIESSIGDMLNARQRKVIDRLFDAEPQGFEGGLSVKNYQKMTNVAAITASRDLGELYESGVLMRTGTARATRYHIHVPDINVLLDGWTPQPLPRTHNKGLYR